MTASLAALSGCFVGDLDPAVALSCTGNDCPDGAVCFAGLCRSDDDVCFDLDDGDVVVHPDGSACPDGVCVAGACVAARCGDGFISAGERCDGDEGCRDDCTRCGDGVIDDGEGCDEGVFNSDRVPGACRSTCVIASCGDGVVDPGEACDDGAGNSDTSPDACRSTCAVPRCGDAVIDSGEACDDGNGVSGDGCVATCSKAEICGDGIVDQGELCDDGNVGSGDGCRGDCLKVELCGDELLDVGEACDDGNADNSDGCVSGCQIARCGDGFVRAGVERCDGDGEGVDCSPACEFSSCEAASDVTLGLNEQTTQRPSLGPGIPEHRVGNAVCAGAGDEAVLQVTAADTGVLRVRAETTGGVMNVLVYRGTCGAEAERCSQASGFDDPPPLEAEVAAGETVFVVADELLAGGPDPDVSISLRLDAEGLEAGLCREATEVASPSPGVDVTATFSPSTLRLGAAFDCAPFGDLPAQAFSFVASQSGRLVATVTDNDDFDPVVVVHDDACGSSGGTCNDDDKDSDGFDSRAEHDVVAGRRVFVIVGDAFPDDPITGSQELRLSLQ